MRALSVPSCLLAPLRSRLGTSRYFSGHCVLAPAKTLSPNTLNSCLVQLRPDLKLCPKSFVLSDSFGNLSDSFRTWRRKDGAGNIGIPSCRMPIPCAQFMREE